MDESCANARPAVSPSRRVPGRSADLCHTAAMTSPRRISPRFPALLALVAAATVMVSACGSSSTSADSASAEPTRDAGNLGVRVCVVNNTSLETSITFTKKDTSQDGAIPAGGRLCGEGTFGVGDDIEATVTWSSPSWQSAISASNPWVGKPSLTLRETFSGGKTACLSNSFGDNETLIGDNGVTRASITRLADDQWKEFEIIFAPSNNPSADGKPRSGEGYRSCAGTPATS